MLNELERVCIEAFRSGAASEPQRSNKESEAWIEFGLTLLLDASRIARERSSAFGLERVELKGDGSPVTPLELEVESLLRARLQAFDPGVMVMGEETGGTLNHSGLTVAIDPVDGTWAFLTGTETYAMVLALFRDGTPVLGMVSNPSTGQLGYATQGGEARLVQLSMFGEPDSASSLPDHRPGSAAVLVNVHPTRRGQPLVKALYEAWQQERIGMVRSPGGSPSWALLEAARGAFVYLNLWSTVPAQPYDLAAGVLLVESAGGSVVDLRGEPIDPVSHLGPFIAGVDESAREKVADIARQVVEE